MKTPPGLERRATGEGSLEFSFIFRAPAQTGYDGYDNIGYGRTPDVEELIGKSLTYLRQTSGQ